MPLNLFILNENDFVNGTCVVFHKCDFIRWSDQLTQEFS